MVCFTRKMPPCIVGLVDLVPVLLVRWFKLRPLQSTGRSSAGRQHKKQATPAAQSHLVALVQCFPLLATASAYISRCPVTA
jgi:hypothetical protein